MSNCKRAEKADYAASIRSISSNCDNPLSFLTLKYYVARHYNIIRHPIDFTLTNTNTLQKKKHPNSEFSNYVISLSETYLA